jgi:uncharacterized SAM-binding protein YcdF (DUF218 family)
MSFYLQKFISAYFLPLPMALTVLLIGILLAWRFRKTGLILALSSWIILCALSLNPISNAITYSLEQNYQPLLRVPAGVRYILVLGGGVRVNPGTAPANTQLASSSLSRLVEGVRLYRLMQQQNQIAQLILSGGSIFNSPNESGIMRNTAVMLGIPKKDLILERGSKNTYEEAQFLRKIVGKEPFLLVTSATHMKRSMALFRAAGTKPIPAPTQYLSKSDEYRLGRYLIPHSSNLVNIDSSIHEYLGLLWARLNNQLNNDGNLPSSTISKQSRRNN